MNDDQLLMLEWELKPNPKNLLPWVEQSVWVKQFVPVAESHIVAEGLEGSV